MSDVYFNWLYDLVCHGRYSKDISFRKLLGYLYKTEFTYIIPMDENRAKDGIALRKRFSYDYDIADIGPKEYSPCSVLEMMIALSIRCEEDIMYDPNVGDRTEQWFWEMIVNLGLGGMMDDIFDVEHVEYIVDRFLNREYEPNGRGGLFFIRNCKYDLRRVEIWYQLCWYLDGFV